MELEDLVEEARAHRITFTLWSRRWDDFKASVTLNWKDHPFVPEEKINIPPTPGVYAFLLQPRIANGLEASYVLYIGESSNLQERFDNYLQEIKSKNARPRIRVYLNQYKSFLRFCCATLPSGVSTTTIEDALLAAFIPPLNVKLPAEVRAVVAAFV
ncbi:MAG: hypothetical protein D6816_09765 [Bacteroidetes bacterium]|nr:MAG: hypothetical protein D6816_09765 [Bacteroidota bacterium]